MSDHKSRHDFMIEISSDGTVFYSSRWTNITDTIRLLVLTSYYPSETLILRERVTLSSHKYLLNRLVWVKANPATLTQEVHFYFVKQAREVSHFCNTASIKHCGRSGSSRLPISKPGLMITHNLVLRVFPTAIFLSKEKPWERGWITQFISHSNALQLAVNKM